ncbi:uncharacterized protein ATNIH1004_008644 [Aspergillus tanneri]|uniref:Uncharacterized protein n=1 Tax=Aspergillus tanneri TaxID=1220188 RepID=A0A5M9MG49_9EURO|nr:uncharacterized protein ATNIH1004_008644 [Aspergillus tanneri]KAA8644440.1 hypothetical protein ATNIH1004_008644 [Aspergillus tanneri]
MAENSQVACETDLDMHLDRGLQTGGVTDVPQRQRTSLTTVTSEPALIQTSASDSHKNASETAVQQHILQGQPDKCVRLSVEAVHDSTPKYTPAEAELDFASRSVVTIDSPGLHRDRAPSLEAGDKTGKNATPPEIPRSTSDTHAFPPPSTKCKVQQARAVGFCFSGHSSRRSDRLAASNTTNLSSRARRRGYRDSSDIDDDNSAPTAHHLKDYSQLASASSHKVGERPRKSLRHALRPKKATETSSGATTSTVRDARVRSKNHQMEVLLSLRVRPKRSSVAEESYESKPTVLDMLISSHSFEMLFTAHLYHHLLRCLLISRYALTVTLRIRLYDKWRALGVINILRLQRMKIRSQPVARQSRIKPCNLCMIGENQQKSRKGLPWSTEEVDLLLKLKPLRNDLQR